MDPFCPAEELEQNSARSMPFHDCCGYRRLLERPERKSRDDMKMRCERAECDLSAESFIGASTVGAPMLDRSLDWATVAAIFVDDQKRHRSTLSFHRTTVSPPRSD
jgi:hypothetical protein